MVAGLEGLEGHTGGGGRNIGYLEISRSYGWCRDGDDDVAKAKRPERRKKRGLAVEIS